MNNIDNNELSNELNNESTNNLSDDSINKSNNLMITVKDKYVLTFVLHALGDTIGFKNSDWKMDYGRAGDVSVINEMVYEFIDLGGVNGIDISDWIISSDTFLHLAIGKTLLKYKNKIDEKFIDSGKENIVLVLNRFIADKKKRLFRYEGETTIKYAANFQHGIDARKLPYDSNSGGNGPSGRSSCIGLAFYKEEDIDKLIDCSINLSRISHNSPMGFLAGFSMAFFTSLAIRNVDICKWPHMLVDILESEKIRKYIDQDITEIQFDYMDYVRYWRKYLDTRFIDFKPIKSRSTSNLIFRIKYYYENFVKNTKSLGIGVSGICAVIMAYDAVLDCNGNWEKIIFYAILNLSDSSTVGAMAGSLFGAYYGFGDVPPRMFDYIEEFDDLVDTGRKIYKKFYKN